MYFDGFDYSRHHFSHNQITRHNDEVAKLQKLLPNISVIPGIVPTIADPSWILIAFSLMTLSLLVGNVVMHQFRSSMSLMYPRFAPYHTAVATFLIVSLIGYSSWRMVACYFDPLLSLVYSASLVSVAIGCQVTIGTVPQSRWRVWLFSISVLLIFLSSFLLTYLYITRTYFIWFVLFYGAAALATTNITLRAIPRLSFTTAGATPVNYWAKHGVKSSTELQVRNNRETKVLDSERRIESLSAATKPVSTWEWADHWRLGNRPNPIRWYWYLVLPFLLTGLTYAFSRFVGPDQTGTLFDSIRAQLITYGVLMPLVAIIGAATFWRARRFILPVELTRPINRNNVLKEWVIGILRDVVPISTATALLPAVAFNITNDKSGQLLINWAWIPGAFVLLALFQVTLAVAIVMIAVLVERTWACYAAILGLFYATGFITFVVWQVAVMGDYNLFGLHYRISIITRDPLASLWFGIATIAAIAALAYLSVKISQGRIALGILCSIVALVAWFYIYTECFFLSYAFGNRANYPYDYPVRRNHVSELESYSLLLIPIVAFFLVGLIAVNRWLRKQHFDFRA